MLKKAVCLYVKDAELDIAEWISYHIAIGFDAFLIYDNGSTDNTADVARSLSSVAEVIVVPWGHATSATAQIEAYNDCVARFRDRFEWIAFIDSDEFIVSEHGHKIGQLLDGKLFTSAIALNWACFGSSGHDDRPDGLMIENFTRRAEDTFDPNRHVKMIVRPDRVLKNVNPHFFETTGAINRVNGKPARWGEVNGVSETVDLSGWRINHYFVRSREQWRAKMMRGYRDTSRGEETFGVYDRNEVVDDSLLKWVPEVHQIITRSRVESAQRERRSFGALVRRWFKFFGPGWGKARVDS